MEEETYNKLKDRLNESLTKETRKTWNEFIEKATEDNNNKKLRK